ncbi:MAG: CaiB/BaiF CoA-transferase family protein [Pseudomonadota bacterium]
MGALDGLLVVAIEQAVAAPLCTQRLADAGARVIKIERPGGETARHYDSVVEGVSSYFAWLNRGKESAVLDLKTEDDSALLRRLLAQADVLVQNLGPGAMKRMGLGQETLQKDFPRLIAASICGYGSDTDLADMKAYDMLVQAESGVCAVTGTAEDPAKIGIPVADLTTGMNAHAAVLEALIARGVTGSGRFIEVSMFDGLADCMAVPFLHFRHEGTQLQRCGMSHTSIYPYAPFDCADGTIIIAVQTNAEFERLCAYVLDRPDLPRAADFTSNTERSANRAALDEILRPIFAGMSAAEAVSRLKRAGIAFGRYAEVSDLAEHRALRVTEAKLPDGTRVTVPLPAGRLASGLPSVLPVLGEHTDSIRREFG